MLQQYFATAWIPRNDGTNNFYTANLGNGIAAIGYKSQPVLVQPGQTGAMTSTLWVGPEIQDKMAAVAPHLDLTVDYGWLWFISQPLFKLLKWIHSFLGNWGFYHRYHLYRSWHHVPADKSAVHLHGEDAYATAEDSGYARASGR